MLGGGGHTAGDTKSFVKAWRVAELWIPGRKDYEDDWLGWTSRADDSQGTERD